MNAEFIVKSGGAHAVLTADELLLVLGCVATHEHSVHRLAARVTAHRQPAEPHGLRKLAEGEVDLRDLFQRQYIELLQPTLFGQVPFAAGVILEQRPAVELDGTVVGADDLPGLGRPAGQPCVVEGQQKLVAVDPPRQLGIEEVTAVAVQDGLSTLSQPSRVLRRL